jgi:microcystin-dependent protein
MCQGQLMAISQNTALFSLIGTFYGGNGTSTFGLPDLRSRIPVHQGQGPGLSPYVVGEQTGTENVTLLTTELPAHNHGAGCFNGVGDSYSGSNAIPAKDAGGNNLYSAPSDQTMAANELSPAGSNLPHNNLQPYLALNYCIALLGIFPSRN